MSSNDVMNNNKTLLDYFFANVKQYDQRIFMTQPKGQGKVLKFTYRATLEEATKMAAYLSTLELPSNSQIAICSKNCAWWIMADLAIQMAGHVTVPIFPTLTKEITRYTLQHSESRLLFIGKMDDAPYAEMKDGFVPGLPTISFPLCPDEDCAETAWDKIIDNSDTLALTENFEPIVRMPEEMATIIYTSGSTGKPKGVMTSYKAMLAATEGFVRDGYKITQKDRYLSYLPIAHGMERWMGECLLLYTGGQLFFAESLTTFLDDLNRCQPTVFLSVPRLWTKFQAKVFEKMPKKKLDRLMKIPLINILIKRKLLKKLGLNKVKLAGSGSAPLPSEVLTWYRNLGLELCEGYGMTENFNYSHVTRPGTGKFSYVGTTYDDVKHRISSKDGELEVLSPGKMMGYYKDDEATRDAITEDGWIRTGDKGEINEEGFLKITGRTKEIFKTSKGKYVAPAPIESLLINHPLVELAVVGGRGYAQPFAVLQLAEMPKFNVVQGGTLSLRCRENYSHELVMHLGTVVNHVLEGHERLQFLVVVSDTWSSENGFLTPTQKIKRSTIEEKYAPLFDGWWDMKRKVIWYGFDGDATAAANDTAAVAIVEEQVPNNQRIKTQETSKVDESIETKHDEGEFAC